GHGPPGDVNKPHSQFSVTHHREGYGVAAGGDGDIVGAMGTLSLGGGAAGGAAAGGRKSLPYSGGAGGSSRLDPYGGSGGGNSGSNHHMMDGTRGAANASGAGIGLHAGGMMPPSPYNGSQMSPYGAPQQMPQAALMGGMPPLTPELHAGSTMGYQLDARHLPQLPPPDPRYDTRIQGDQQQRGSLG
ncbi:unnamed protein product, partial [Ectocarpus sp. 4 AP-2014]